MNATERLEALACPFCGSVNVSDGEVLSERDGGQTHTQSACLDCGALGPEAETDGPDYGDARAIAAWNRRAALTPAPEGGEFLRFVEIAREGTPSDFAQEFDAVRKWLAAAPPVGRDAELREWSLRMAALEAGQEVGAGSFGIPDEPVGRDAVQVETVGFIREDDDGDRYIDWTLEGGIHALEVGDELVFTSQRVTNDEGHGELYATPVAVVSDAMVRRAFVAYWGGQPNDEGYRVMKRALEAALIDKGAA